MIVGTPASRALCERIAGLTDTVILGFSRGKDAVACALWLKQFFPVLKLFHRDSCPGMPMVDRSLDYYEDVLGVEIDRCISPDWFAAVGGLQYQLIEDEDDIDDLELGQSDLGHRGLIEVMRAKYRCPGAWMAWGMSAKDSITRNAQASLLRGYTEETQTIYPCFDWSKGDVLAAIESAGVRLADDYLYGNRSFSNPVANGRSLVRIRDKSPEDWAAIQLNYPLIEASIARLAFRDAHFGVVRAVPGSSEGQKSRKPKKPVEAKPEGLASNGSDW